MTTVVDRPVPRTVVRREPATPGRPPRRTLSDIQVVIARPLLVIALFLVWILVYLIVLSPFQESHAQHRLYSQLRTELALGEAPTGAPIDAGKPVALLSIPRAGVKNQVVVEGTSTRQLQDGPGHLRGSVLPGQHGTSVLLGRALSFAAPFGRLDRLRAGDPIKVTTGQGTFTYTVADARRKGDPVPAAPTDAKDGRLTLVTAVGSGFASRLTPSDTVYVDATLTGKAVGPGPVATVVADERPMKAHVSAGTLAFLALSLQLLIAAFIGAAWLRARWSHLGAWIVGTPMIVAALWVVSSLASQLLPNLI
ncbi:MAG TPA: class E sortase [Marmoricola sp.]|jgi:sortase A|nr:class E sortase [Marmoricola sp.]